tara:strand:- start:291 stop:779 length:489 start_codon:yes stop_codon:yes gene_type:complete
MKALNFFGHSFNLPNGTPYPVADLKGKTILVVNTATKCGLTPQFSGLELLHAKHEPDGLVVLGFPCNQFGGQEPETNERMIETCEINHGVTFQLLEKIEVNGKNVHPVFNWLKSKSGSFFGSRIKWNFTKFLIAPDGETIKRYAPTTKPEKIEADILALLNK